MKIPKDELLEILDDMSAPFLWAYYTARMHMRFWHLRVRCRCSLCIRRALSRISHRNVVFYLQIIADSLATIDPQIRPLVERWLQLKSQIDALMEADDHYYKVLQAERDEVQDKIQDHYGGDEWPQCLKFSYSATISWAIVDWIYDHVLPVIDYGMPWSEKERSNA